MADKRFYKKLVLTSPIRTKNGKKIEWENAGWNTGILATDNKSVIAELDACVKQNMGGVIAIDEAAYEGLKKNSKPASRPRQAASAIQLMEQKMAQRAAAQSPASAASSSQNAADNAKAVAEQPATATGVFPS